MKNQQSSNSAQDIVYNLQGVSDAMNKKIVGLVKALNEPLISIKKLRAFLSQGIPDQVSIVRQYTWKVILGYLPKNKTKWQEHIDKQQKIYADFVKQYLPNSKYNNFPILMNKSQQNWNQYEEDYYLWEQIEKDTCRTQSDLSFFSQEVQPIMIPFATSARKERYKLINGQSKEIIQAWLLNKQQQKRTYRYDYMTRILFIYAKLNPKAGYVQGMNEVLAPIFYLVNARRKNVIDEPACFFMFNNVMTDLIELNIEAFDKKQNGIHGRIQQISKILLALQPKLWQRIKQLKIDLFFFCFRWLTLLFAQQFQLFQTLRIWQSIFSYQDRSNFVNYFIVTLLCSQKQVILKEEYSGVLTHMKHIRQHINLSNVLFRACEMYHELKGVDILNLAQRNLDKMNKRDSLIKQKANSLFKFIKKMI